MTANAVSYVGSDDHPLEDRFLRWQCRVRQIMVRERAGQPGDAIMPSLTLAGETEPLGQVITVMSKAPMHAVTAELMHMARKTNDPAQRREQILKFLSAAYYQKPQEFSSTLTTAFAPDSPGARRVEAAGACCLTFDAYNQRFDLECTVYRLEEGHPLREATWWHNFLFNPSLPAETIVLAFEPDWERSSCEQGP